MQGKTAACTIVAKNYLPFARVLMDSLRRHDPHIIRIVVLVDDIDNLFDPALEPFDIVLSSDLPIESIDWFHFKYTVLELSTAVKPYALEYILNRYGVDQVIYLDPDICVYQSLESLVERLRCSQMLLTPHLTAPLDDDKSPSDIDILRSGTYNLGFIAISDSQEMRLFLRWWQNKLYDHCVVDLPRGLFVDQKWMDLVPGLYSKVEIIRDPGYNVAYWNLSHRDVQNIGGHWLVNGEPLSFFHFSGFDPLAPDRFSKHQNRYRLSDRPAVEELALNYGDQLLANGYASCRQWPYRYSRFANGFPLADLGRWVQNEAPHLPTHIKDPFSHEGYEAYVNVWNEPINNPNGDPSGITRMAHRIYQLRADVQKVMPDVFGSDQVRYANWLLSSGREEHNIPEVFLRPVRDMLDRRTSERTPVGTPARPGDVIDSVAAAEVVTQSIYQSRPDLQRRFRDPGEADAIGYLIWLLSHGRQEYQLEDKVLRPVHDQWKRAVSRLPVAQRLWSDVLLRTHQLSTLVRGHLRESQRPTPLPTAMAPRVNDEPVTAVSRELLRNGVGVNVVGYLRAEMGVGESGRISTRAARSAGIAVALKDIHQPQGPYRLQDDSLGEPSESFPYAVNLFHVNADQTHVVYQSVPDITANRYSIGFWAWELEDFPEIWNPAFHYCQEVWTPSSFCQDAISRHSPVPVLRMPHPVEVKIEEVRNRCDLGLPEDRFVFLTVFDMLSVFERKNPLAVIAAFQQAFSNQGRHHLVVKVNNAQHRPLEMKRLQQACSGNPAISIIDHIYSRNDINNLIRCCDCLVSLHRSEGFGLTIAEAMYMGKPVVVTGYSGNMDFTHPDNSYLVRYKITSVGPGNDPYPESSHWAEPSIEEAAEHMRLISAGPERRLQVASAGQAYVRDQLSPRIVGQRMKDRLEKVYQKLLRAGR